MRLLSNSLSSIFISVPKKNIISCLFIMIFSFLTFHSEAKKKAEVEGEDKACAGTEEEYSTNFKRCSRVSWKVSGQAGITEAKGIDIKGIRTEFNIAPEDRLQWIEARRRKVKVKFISHDGQVSKEYVVKKKTGYVKGKSKANYIVVKFDSSGISALSWNGRMGWSGLRGKKEAYKSVLVTDDISKNTFQLYLNNIEPDSILWGQSLTLATDTLTSAIYKWEIIPAIAVIEGNLEEAALNISGFSNPGIYEIALNISDGCGNVLTLDETLTVLEPSFTFSNNTGSGSGSGNSTESISPTCAEAEAGFEIGIDAELSKDVVFEWILPYGWKSDINPSSIEVLNGKNYYHYKGVGLSSLLVKKESDTPLSALIYLKLSLGDKTITEEFSINSPDQVYVSLPDYQGSCSDTVAITGSVTSGTAPFYLTWSNADLSGIFEKETEETSLETITSTFKADTSGIGYVVVSVTDSEGCKASDSTRINVMGADFDKGESGWLSGTVKPFLDGVVASNIAESPAKYRLYFVENGNGEYKLRFYDGTGSYDPLDLVDAELSIPYSGTNYLSIIDVGGNQLIFFKSSSGILSVAPFNGINGKHIKGHQTTFSSILPQGEFHIDDISSNIMNIYWKDINGNLLSQLFTYDYVMFSFSEMREIDTVATATSSAFDDLVKDDVKVIGNNLFYFKSDGGFYYRQLSKPEVEQKLNEGVSDAYVAENSNVDHDADGNIYFCGGGDLWYTSFDISGNFIGLNEIDIPVNCNGEFTINRSTNVIYYTGTDKNIYQVFREENFSASGLFGVVKATSSNVSDNALGNLIYKSPHLIYLSANSAVNHLYYPILDYGENCIPSHLRLNNFGDDHIREAGVAFVKARKKLETGGKIGHSYYVYPNPFSNKLIFPGTLQVPFTIELITGKGITILKKDIVTLPYTLDTEVLEQGLYFCKITSEGQAPVVLKVVKE